jgi:PAS domain-containing protein
MGRFDNLQDDPGFFELLTGSHARLVGKELVSVGQDAHWLYELAPFALLAHNTDPDPRFIYANRTAQSCFEYSWDEFVQLPSRLSAEAPDRLERQRQLEQVARKGYVSDYRGVRISGTGRRFWIENAVIWQLQDASGKVHGQAALFDSWRPL